MKQRTYLATLQESFRQPITNDLSCINIILPSSPCLSSYLPTFHHHHQKWHFKLSSPPGILDISKNVKTPCIGPLASWAIFGIVAGCAVFLVLVVYLAWRFWFKKRRSRLLKNRPSGIKNNSGRSRTSGTGGDGGSFAKELEGAWRT